MIFRPPNKADGEKPWGIETKRNKVWPSTWTARPPQMEANREMVWVCGEAVGDKRETGANKLEIKAPNEYYNCTEISHLLSVTAAHLRSTIIKVSNSTSLNLFDPKRRSVWVCGEDRRETGVWNGR